MTASGGDVTSVLDARVRVEHADFCRALQKMGAPELLFDPIAAYPEMIDVANALHLIARIKSINSWMARIPSPMAGIPLSMETDLPDAEALANESCCLFRLGEVGMLSRLLDYPDEDLHNLTLARVYETLIPIVVAKYRTYGNRLDPLDVAHELLDQNLADWARAYDPQRASLRTYLSHNSRPNGMRKASRINVGLSGDVRDQLFPSRDLDQEVADSIDSARVEAELPLVLRLHLDGHDYRHISSLLGISQVAARVQVHRYIKAERVKARKLGKGQAGMESKEVSR